MPTKTLSDFNAVKTIVKKTTFDGQEGSYLDLGRVKAMEVPNVTVALSFSMDKLFGNMALISKDSDGNGLGGGFTVMVYDGTLVVHQESATDDAWLKVPELILQADTTYHLAVSFGDKGIQVWVNGQLAAADPTFKQGLEHNDNSLVIGGTRSWRASQSDDAHSLAQGTIGDVAIFDSQLGAQDVASLAGVTDAGMETAAIAALDFADLAPAFVQMHHASDTFKAIAVDYGFDAMGNFSGTLSEHAGNRKNNTMKGNAENEAFSGGMGNDRIIARSGNDFLQGDYGNDVLKGGAGNDVLDGGHGEDRLFGGIGDDLLISRSDAREPRIANLPGRDETDPLNELTNGKLYADQPIPGNDMLVGGKGADIFYFQVLVNAKQRFIEKHTDSNGVIDWHGVTGENDSLHDHWVDTIGHDYVMDYNREQGDRIVIEGHTSAISQITYGDANGDGVMDHSVISIYSDQGSNGGAHHMDQLGQITVYGDLVKLSDIEHTSRPAYGIIADISDLQEALDPLSHGKSGPKIKAPKKLQEKMAIDLPSGANTVLEMAKKTHLDGTDGSYMNVGRVKAMEVPNVTVALSFSMDKLFGNMALISKDSDGNGLGGGFTVMVYDGTLVVHQESATDDAWLKVPELILQADTTYHLAVSFGDKGIQVWVNGQLAAADPTFKQGLEHNDNSLVIGGTRSWRASQSDDAHSLAQGTIGDVAIFDSQLGAQDVASLAGVTDAGMETAAIAALDFADLAPAFVQMHHASDTFKAIAVDYGFDAMGNFSGTLSEHAGNRKNNTMKGNAENEAFSGGMGNDRIIARSGNDFLQGDYGNDVLKGGAGNDVLDGGHGEDRLFGGIGDDLLISRSDAREPRIANLPGRDETDPLNELTNGKLYADQPIPGNDMLVGGKGADIFYFQVLVNAKQRFIEKHTDSNGVIDWHGVTGENDSLHDHWVDTIGHDYVMDYNREQGDRIVIEGHTSAISQITYGDANGDGVMDHSVISIYSDQGSNGGAHHMDQLGQITVYGDLVKLSDIEHTSRPAYGIIADISDLQEALDPLSHGKSGPKIKAPKKLIQGEDLTLESGAKPVFTVPGSHHFLSDSESYLAFQDKTSLQMPAATIMFSFRLDEVTDWQALFSKDAKDYGAGGHTAAWVTDTGNIVVRIQSGERSHYLEIENAVQAGQTYDFALSFGPKGAELYLDGVRMSYDRDITLDWQHNSEALIIGGSGSGADPGTLSSVWSRLAGDIENFAIYDQQLSASDIAGTALRDGFVYQSGVMTDYRISSAGADGVKVQGGSEGPMTLGSETRFISFQDGTVALDNIRFGTAKAEEIRGSEASDIIYAYGADDVIVAGENDDFVFGGTGEDQIYGQDGRDQLFGGAGDDYLDGGNQNDRLFGGAGDDQIKGGQGADLINGGWGDDYIYGNSWGDAGTSNNDRVVYDGVFADYSFSTKTSYNSTRGVDVDRLVVTDSASGGADGFYEGKDILMDIDFLVFADQTVAVADLL